MESAPMTPFIAVNASARYAFGPWEDISDARMNRDIKVYPSLHDLVIDDLVIGDLVIGDLVIAD